MFGSNVTVKGGPSLPSFQPVDQIDVYYTGKNINATDGSRTANTTNLTVGDVLVLDPYGFDSGIGTDFANPTTGHLSNFAVVVTYVPPDSVLGGGGVKAVPLSRGHCVTVPCNTKANMTAGTTCLIAVDQSSASVNQRYLAASTTVNSALTATGILAIAAQTVDTSSTAAVKLVQPAH